MSDKFQEDFFFYSPQLREREGKRKRERERERERERTTQIQKVIKTQGYIYILGKRVHCVILSTFCEVLHVLKIKDEWKNLALETGNIPNNC
jgi:hypothetical protein